MGKREKTQMRITVRSCEVDCAMGTVVESMLRMQPKIVTCVKGRGEEISDKGDGKGEGIRAESRAGQEKIGNRKNEARA